MTDLTLIKKNGGVYIDSREVAEMLGKQHGHLMRDIHKYVATMGKITQSNFRLRKKSQNHVIYGIIEVSEKRVGRMECHTYKVKIGNS